MKHFKLLKIGIALSILVAACEKEEDKFEAAGYTKGVFIVNEGLFNASNGSVSYYNPDSNKIINNIFEEVNGRPTGDIVQSFAVVNDSMGLIIVNNSAKIEIVRLSSFEAVTAPVPVTYPRYFLQVSNTKGYISAGSLQGYVYVMDLNNYTITDTIGVGYGAESMVLKERKAYIANSGGWSSDSTVSVINTVTDEVDDIISTSKIPSDMVLDHNGNLWVYCKGFTNYVDIETEAYLQKIDPETKAILWQSKVGMALDYASTPAKCAVSDDGKTIYYMRPEGIYAVNADSPSPDDEPLITGNFYGVEVNPNDGNIYVFEASFTGSGSMKIYDREGLMITEKTVGIGPNGAVFNL